MKRSLFARLLAAILAFLLIIAVSIVLTGCSKNPNEQVSHGYRYAMIRLPDGSLVGGKVQEYSINNGWVQVYIDGGAYATHASNVVITMEYD